MAREVVTGRQVAKAYLVEDVYGSLAASVGGHSVHLEDDLPPSADSNARVRTTVRIIVDGNDYAAPVDAEARPYFEDSNRYHGYVHLKRLTDRRSGETSIVVAQALGRPAEASRASEGNLRYRVLTISGNGVVKEEVFTYAQRGAPAVRTRLIDGVVPHPIGYHSDLMQVWPSIFYPVLYPWLSGLVGGVLLLSWFATRRRIPM